jgi:hypothetical protein
MTDALLLRKAKLLARDYTTVKEVVVPRNAESGQPWTGWPEYIRYEGRIFARHHMAYPRTIEADKQQDQEQPYLEVEVWDAVPETLHPLKGRNQ